MFLACWFHVEPSRQNGWASIQQSDTALRRSPANVASIKLKVSNLPFVPDKKNTEVQSNLETTKQYIHYALHV